MPPRHPLDTPVKYLKGVGPHRAGALASLNIDTVENLLFLAPRRYVDRTMVLPIGQLRHGTTATVIGTVSSVSVRRGRRSFLSVTVRDDTGGLTCMWFKGVQYFRWAFKKGDLVMFSGKVSDYKGMRMTHPDFESLESDEDPEDSLHMGRIIPLYPSTAALSKARVNSKMMRTLIHAALQQFGGDITENLPVSLIRARNLLPLRTALQHLHFPEDPAQVAAARARLGFNEFFFMETVMAIRRHRIKTLRKEPVRGTAFGLVEKMTASLPYRLTGAQERVIREIMADMDADSPMNRLLQGDVGSGKTVVALAALLKAVEQGHQAVLMAPTEVLAEQHYLTIYRLLEDFGLRMTILTGGKKQDQAETLSAIATGTTQIVVGTHAVFQRAVEFYRLGLVVVDEQHKFGVMQRAALYRKGTSPDVLVMTATPIPRTLSLSVYGDLDVSVIDEMPPGRGTVKTASRAEKDRPGIYRFIREEVAKGRQAYIVYPLIEESEKIDLEAALTGYEKISRDIFPDISCGLLHGRMKGPEKEKVLARFKRNEISVLVATTVIEVGVDVPNATVMLIEHAERFGLAQLHQLRGRIGRGTGDAYCILCARSPLSADARQRLKALTGTTDGFKIAELDLEIRGPGEFLGTRQHGLPPLQMVSLVTDTRLLVDARDDAFRLIEDDPRLVDPAHKGTRQYLLRHYKDKLSLAAG